MAIAQFSTLWLCCAPKRRPGPVGGPQHERHRHLAVGHVARLGDLVDDHVPGHREEVGEHQLGDRAQAGHRRAHRRADDGLLADRRVADAVRPELVEQPLGQLEHAAGGADVLADQHDVRIAPHLLGDARGDRRRYVSSAIDTSAPSPSDAPDLGRRQRPPSSSLVRTRGRLGRAPRPRRRPPPRRVSASIAVEVRGVDAVRLEPGAIGRDRVACLPRGDLVVGPVLARDRRASGRRAGRSRPR